MISKNSYYISTQNILLFNAYTVCEAVNSVRETGLTLASIFIRIIVSSISFFFDTDSEVTSL